VRSPDDLVYSRDKKGKRFLSKEHNMRLIIYIIGFLILIGGLAWAAITAGVPQLYVQIGAVILLGIGIITGVSRTRYRSGSDVTVVKDNDSL
jgi:hypothetical protein